MISGSHVKKEDTKPSRRDVNKSLNTLGKKPLTKHRFYLDVKNRVTANKLETKIKDLGGVLELFLIREVTHVITDREEWGTTKVNGLTPKTPHSVNYEPFSNGSPNCIEYTPNRGRPKTRADAMLEKARRTSATITRDPLEEAKSWGITIWTVVKAFTWLDKVSVSIKISCKKTNHKIFELKSPYIKFEAFDRQTRPVFQEIANWPSVNLQGSNRNPGVTCRSLVERNMTRKTRSNHPRIDTALQPGYCEVCRVEYPRLDKHLESANHLNFIKDNSNFICLDKLISDTEGIETFVKINIAQTEEKLNGIRPSVNISTMRRRMPRTRRVSLCDKIKSSPLSPTRSDSGHKLRSRRHITVTNNCLKNATEDDKQQIKLEDEQEIREVRSSTRQLLKLAEHEAKDTWDSGRPKRTCIKQKRISSDERLVVDNRTYYKVEVFPNKLRSSGISLKEIETSKRVQTPIPEENEEIDKALIVKFRRLRTSELKRLNNEAENFLFPRKDESSSDEDIDADGPDTTVSVRDRDSTLLLSSEPEESPKKAIKQEDDASMDSNWSETSSVKKKKRRTHAEAFILDNQKYYKFETPGSRLRYQGSYLPPLPTVTKSPKHNGEHNKTDDKHSKKDKASAKEVTQKESTITKKSAIKEKNCPKEKNNVKEKVNVKNKVNLKDKTSIKEKGKTEEIIHEKLKLGDIQFSFERVPQSEPWYQTFQRQDEGKEFYTCFKESEYWKPFLLPYQMDSIPPLDPRVCIKAYQQVKKQFIGTSSASTSAGCSTPDPQCVASPPEFHEDSSKASEDSDLTSENKNDEEEFEVEERAFLRNKKRRGVMVSKNPRKSPRQHASTLAILSSLIHQRKKRGESHKSKNCESPDVPKQNLPAIAEMYEEDIKPVFKSEETDYDVLAKNLDDILLHSIEDFEQLELSCEIDPLINLNCRKNAIEILHEYDKVKEDEKEEEVTSTVVCKKPSRKKKKKNNRTGWPNKNRRRREVVKDIDESTVDSLSVHAESDYVEDNCDEVDSNITQVNYNVKNVKSDHELPSKCKINNSANKKIDFMYNNIDQSNTKLNVNNSLNVQTGKLEFDRSRSEKLDRVETVRDRDILSSVHDKVDRVVDLDKWENAEKVLSAKLSNNEINTDIQFQPYVRVQKLESDTAVKFGNRRLRSSSSPHRTVKRARRMPGSPKSPRMLRKPRGRWYRER